MNSGRPRSCGGVNFTDSSEQQDLVTIKALMYHDFSHPGATNATPSDCNVINNCGERRCDTL
jgi:hypothetical protein